MDDSDIGWGHSRRDSDDGGRSSKTLDNNNKDREDLEVRGRSSKSRKPANADVVDEKDDRNRSSYSDRSEPRKRLNSLSHANNSSEEEYEARRGSRSKFPKRSPSGTAEERLYEGNRDIDSSMKRNREEDVREIGGTVAAESYNEISQSKNRSERERELGMHNSIECEFDATIGERHVRVNETLQAYPNDTETGPLQYTTNEDIKQKERYDETRDEVELKTNMEDDVKSSRMDGSKIEKRQSTIAQTTENVGTYPTDTREKDHLPLDASNEQRTPMKDRERAHGDDRSNTGRSRNWIGKREQEEGSEYWKRDLTRRDPTDSDDADTVDWKQQERLDYGNFQGRSGYRKDSRPRPDSGNRYDNSDSIEIRPNRNLNFGREVPSSARRVDMGVKHDDEKWAILPEDRMKAPYNFGSELIERYHDGPVDPNYGRTSLDSHSDAGMMHGGSGGTSQSGNSPIGNNPATSPFGRDPQKGVRPAKGARSRSNWRDVQRPPFGHLGLPPNPIQPLGPGMSPSSGPSLPPGVFIPPFPAPVLWPGARGIDVNMLAIPPNLPPIAPVPGGTGFGPNAGVIPSHQMQMSQPNSGMVNPPALQGSDFNPKGMCGRDMPIEKAHSGWMPTRNSMPVGKAPSRGEQNDYSQNFVDTGMRPQNFIRELELTSVIEDYPKLRELIQRKDEIVAKSATPPMYYKCDLREHVLSPDFFGTKFDVILIDPPWEEYIHRAPGITDHIEHWTYEEIMNLKIEAIADTPSFIFLWVGDGVGLEQGRQCLKKWGFRRCEDICWVKTNKKNATPGLRHDSRTLFQHSKEHCLMGIKGTVRRSTDGHVIHANIDTDVIIAEEPPDGSTKKPDDMYRIVEHFALGRRRLELFGEDHNIRPGWLTLGKGLSSSNFNKEAYVKNFGDRDGKVWQGGGGRNPPPEAPHLVVTTPEIEALRPKSPPQKSQQPLPPLGSGGSSNRRSSGSSPSNVVTVIGSDSTPAHWSSSPLIAYGDGGAGSHF